MLAFNHAVKLTSTLTVDNRTPSASRSRPAGAQASCQADNQAADSGYVSQPDASSQEPGIARDSRPVPVSAIENTIAASAQNVPLETAPEPESANIRSSAGTQNSAVESSPETQHATTARRRINGLDVYSLDIPREIQERYQVIQGRLEEGLCKYLTIKKKPLDGLTLTLMVLGTNERKAEPYIVARCEPKSRKKTLKYLHKPNVKRLWQGREGASFNVEVTMPLIPTALEGLREVFGTFQGEFGSAAIQIYSEKGKPFFATIGGDVFLHHTNGTSKKYGLTVHHLSRLAGDMNTESTASPSSDSDPDDWSSDSDESVDNTFLGPSRHKVDDHRTGAAVRKLLGQSADSASYDSSAHEPFESPSRSVSKSRGSLNSQSQSQTSPAMQEKEMSSPQQVYDPGTVKTEFHGSQQLSLNETTSHASGGRTPENDSPNRVPLGTLVSEILASDVARNRDWAFVEYVEQPSSDSSVSKRPQRRLEAAAFEPINGSIKVSVIYHGVTHSGRLSAVPTSTIVPGGSTFVSVYTFSFDKAPAELDGISGSWVVQEGEHEIQVYGQVVAKDAFGDVYIMPMVDILHDVEKVFNGRIASLHGHSLVAQESKDERPGSIPQDSKRNLSDDYDYATSYAKGQIESDILAKEHEALEAQRAQSAVTRTATAPSLPRADSQSQARPASPVSNQVRHSIPHFISGTPQGGGHGKLDPSFRMRTKTEFFTVGRVFAAVQFTEPADERATILQYGEGLFCKIRQFVVTSVEKDFVYACAISTYRNQGTLEAGCSPGEHAIVYNTGTDPETCFLPGERESGLYREPIEVSPASSGSYLIPGSRICFGDVYAIEWNVRVKDVGRVVASDRRRLVEYYNEEYR